MRYVYLGDRLTREDLKGQACNPVRRLSDGKCIVGRSMASQLVVFASGETHVVLRRRLRLVEKAS